MHGTGGQRERQRRYRERLAAKGAPESDDLERAIAEATYRRVAAMRAGEMSAPEREATLALLRASARVLVEKGYDADEVKRRLSRWLGLWS